MRNHRPVRSLFRLAWNTFVVVFLVHGPAASEWLVRAMATGPERPNTPLQAGETGRLDGVLDTAHTRFCPPGWLVLGGAANGRTRAFSPLRNNDQTVAWIALPDALAQRVRDNELQGTMLHEPMVWSGLHASGLSPAHLAEIPPQIRFCPTRGGPDIARPAVDGVAFGELVDVRVNGASWLADRARRLTQQILLTWFAAFVALLLYRRLSRRKGRNSVESEERWFAQARSIVRAHFPAFAFRSLLCTVLLVGAAQASGRLDAIWVRAWVPSHASELLDTREGYGTFAGTATRAEALRCQEGADGSETLLVPVFSTEEGALQDLVLIRPAVGKDEVLAALEKHPRIPLHVTGYRRSTAEARADYADKLRHCESLSGTEPASLNAWLSQPIGVVEVAPEPPAVYQAMGAAWALLILQFGLAMGYAWTRWRQPAKRE